MPVTKPAIWLVAEADLPPKQIQDLAEAIADIKNADAGIDLKFKLRIELGGESRLPNEAIAQINQLLRDISDSLELR